MTHVHVVVRRVNPAFKIDLVQVGYVEDGRFKTLHLDDLARTPISDYVEYSSIADSPYIDHRSVPSLVEAFVAYPDFSIDFFDNTLVLMFSTDLTHNEITSKEEGKGN